MADLSLLDAPIRVGPATLRGRVYVPAHQPGLAHGGIPGPRYIAYQRARARAGVAMQVTGATPVVHSGVWDPKIVLHTVDDRIVPGYQRLAEAVHAEVDGCSPSSRTQVRPSRKDPMSSDRRTCSRRSLARAVRAKLAAGRLHLNGVFGESRSAVDVDAVVVCREGPPPNPASRSSARGWHRTAAGRRCAAPTPRPRRGRRRSPRRTGGAEPFVREGDGGMTLAYGAALGRAARLPSGVAGR